MDTKDSKIIQLPTEEFEDDLQEDTQESLNAENSEQDEKFGLPPALHTLRVKQYVTGGFIFFLSIGLAIVCKDWHLLALMLLSVWFVYNGFVLSRHYNEGQIEEKLLVCVSVKKSTIQDMVSVGFRTDDEYPSFYQFKIPGKRRADDFIPNAAYLVYYNVSTPSQLLAYGQP